MNERLTTATKLVNAGLSVLPIGDNKFPASDKLPLVADSAGREFRSWKPFTIRQPDQNELQSWFGNGANCGIGIIAGSVSRNLEILDFDSLDVLEPFTELIEERSPGLLRKLLAVETPRPGRHLYYRCAQIEGNKKLAQRPVPVSLDGLSEDEAKKRGWRKRPSDRQWFELKTLIETRGEGGYVVSPGSPSRCHPSGGVYKLRNGDFDAIPEISPEERRLLFECARALDESPLLAPVIDPQPKRGRNEASLLRPGDDFNQRGNVSALLERHGWTQVRSFGNRELWRRPGKDKGWSASLLDEKVFYSFSTSTIFESERGYSPFHAFALLEHNGDFQAAAKALAQQGYGEPSGGGFVGSAPEAFSEVIWPTPKPLPDGLRAVPELPQAIIPEALRDWLADTSERLQVPLDYPAAAAIVALSSVVGSQLRIRPKRRDDWTVTPNLWGAVVGRPGTMKSPAISEALKPLNRLVKEAEADFADKKKSWLFDVEKAEARKLARREEMKKAAKRGDSLDVFSLDDATVIEPYERRFIVNDATIEKYGELLNQNPNGLLYFRDELTGWLRSLEDERRANDRAFFLEAWNGDGSYCYDRIGRGHLKIENTTTSIFGGIQPGPLMTYLRTALSLGGDDGLLQRFQVLVYPDAPKDWKNVDKWPETKAHNRAFAVFKALAEIDGNAFGAEADAEGKLILRFNEEAQEFFNKWLTDLMQELKSGAIEHPLLESHFTKYRKLMPALSLIFHLCDVTNGQVSGPVSLTAAERAAAWCQYLWEHAQRIYGLALGADALNARTLARHLQRGEVEDGFTARLVAQKGWAGLNTVEAVREAAETLTVFDWLRAIEIRNAAGGRPTVQYQISPQIQEVRL